MALQQAVVTNESSTDIAAAKKSSSKAGKQMFIIPTGNAGVLTLLCGSAGGSLSGAHDGVRAQAP